MLIQSWHTSFFAPPLVKILTEKIVLLGCTSYIISLVLQYLCGLAYIICTFIVKIVGHQLIQHEI
jgi:hypothetical protein